MPSVYIICLPLNSWDPELQEMSQQPPGQTGPRTPRPKCFRAQGRGHGCRGDKPGQDPSLGSCPASEQQVPGLVTDLEAWATPSSSWGLESVAWAGQVAGRAEAEGRMPGRGGSSWRGGVEED